MRASRPRLIRATRLRVAKLIYRKLLLLLLIRIILSTPVSPYARECNSFLHFKSDFSWENTLRAKDIIVKIRALRHALYLISLD